MHEARRIDQNAVDGTEYIGRGLHVIYTKENWEELTSSVNPGVGEQEDHFKEDRAAFRRSLDQTRNILAELDKEGYVVKDVELAAPEERTKGYREVLIEEADGLLTLYVRERWEVKGDKRTHASWYELEPDNDLITRTDAETDGISLNTTQRYMDLESFNSLSIITPEPTVGEVRQIRQLLANDVQVLRPAQERNAEVTKAADDLRVNAEAAGDFLSRTKPKGRYKLEDTVLMAAEPGILGRRIVGITLTEDERTLRVWEGWTDNEGRKRSHGCTYDLDPNAPVIRRLRVESDGKELDHDQKHEGRRSFTGEDLITPVPQADELSRITGILADDVSRIKEQRTN